MGLADGQRAAYIPSSSTPEGGPAHSPITNHTQSCSSFAVSGKYFVSGSEPPPPLPFRYCAYAPRQAVSVVCDRKKLSDQHSA